MKKSVFYLIFWFLLMGCPLNATAQEKGRLFIDGVSAYKKGDYQRAVSAFQKVVEGGVENGKLFYNLGNSYLKSGDLGNAVFWYEKALTLIPSDPDLMFNHDYALTLIKDETREVTAPIVRILFFWKYQLNRRTVLWTAILLNALFWIIVSVMLIRRKRVLRSSTVILAVLALIFILTGLFNYYEAAYIRNAVILPEKISVRSGLTDEATELFVLHAGTRVRVDKENNTHFRIQYTKDKIGWIKKEQAGLI